MPRGGPAGRACLLGVPLTEPPRSPQSPQAEPVSPGTETGQEKSPPPGKQPDELTVADPTPGPEMRSHNLARPPSDKELNGFVAGFIKNTTDAGEFRQRRDCIKRPEMPFQARRENVCLLSLNFRQRRSLPGALAKIADKFAGKFAEK